MSIEQLTAFPLDIINLIFMKQLMRLLNILWRKCLMQQNRAREEIVKLFLDYLEKEDIPWH